MGFLNIDSPSYDSVEFRCIWQLAIVVKKKFDVVLKAYIVDVEFS